MGAEEKNSSDNSEGKTIQNSKCDLKIHCFPEISSKGSEDNLHGEDQNYQFKQNHIDLNDDKESIPWLKSDSQPDSAELEKLINQARENGYSSGFKDGQLKEKEKIDILADTIAEAISNLEFFKLKLIEEAKESVVKLALAISNKIILNEPTIDKEVLVSIVRNALKMVVDPTNLKIKANPDDLRILNENIGSLETIIGKNATVKIESDETILPGGCMIETDFGDIDARIDAQFKIIEKALMEEFNLKVKDKTR